MRQEEEDWSEARRRTGVKAGGKLGWRQEDLGGGRRRTSVEGGGGLGWGAGGGESFRQEIEDGALCILYAAKYIT